MRDFWNANTHYHGLVLASLPQGASRVLDVGCGDGILAADLVDAGVRHVVGLDVDRPVLDRARARHLARDIEWVHGDVHQVALEPESFAAMAVTARQALGLVRGGWTHTAPQTWPPPLNYGEMRALGARVLPGVCYRRHALGRYSLVWHKPGRNA